jgi:two-component system, NarL family, response regulator YdfI
MTVRDDHPLRVLVVAASATRRADLAEMVVKASSARAITSPALALDRIRQMDLDIVVIDIDNPALGRATLALLREIHLGVIALAESPAARWTADALAGGISAILSREVVLDELRLALQAAENGLVLLSPGVVRNQPPLTSLALAEEREAPDPGETLTPREHEILRLVSEGLGNREIARRLSISEHTVKFHVSSVLAKLDAGSRTEAVSHGIKNGLIAV